MEDCVEIAKRLVMGLFERMELRVEIEGAIREGDLYLEVRGDKEGLLIGKHGRTLDSLQILVNRMVNKQLKEPVRVILDINQYKKRRTDSLTSLAMRSGQRAKMIGKTVTIGPFNPHDRRIIHIALREDPSLETESLGEGEMKKIAIIPKRAGGGETGNAL